jgi:hypothetical protein
MEENSPLSASMNIHHIESLELKGAELAPDATFCSRDLIVTGKDGAKFTLRLFANDAESLKV